MKKLEERILRDGRAIGNDILKVDSFLNHQLDVVLIDEIGEEIARLFAGCGANKVMTVEASGIPPAVAAARALGGIPVIFAKKAAPSTMVDGAYEAPVKSFTKGTVSSIRLSKSYLGKGDKVLIVDDFLAAGEAGMGMLSLIEQAGAECVGFAAVIEKQYQGGSERLRAKGVDVKSLAVISRIEDGKVYFAG